MITATKPGRTRLRASIALFAGLALLLGGCSGGDDSSSPDDTSQERDGGSATAVSPLTGLPAKHAPDKPVMVVKVDNTSSARPQAGLDGADLVVEELVEGGMTRLAAFFYSEHPKDVGPVRSMRDSDVGIVSPTGGKLLASGGAPGTTDRIDEAGIDVLTEGDAGFSRDGSRTAPYNLMVNLADAADGLEAGDAPDPYLPFDDKAVKRGKAVDSFSVSFSGSSTTSWDPTKGGWVRANGPVSPNDDFVAKNVLVLNVEVGDAGYLDPGGNPVPETKFVGDGKAQLFSGGKVVTGTWSKDDLDSNIDLQTRKGDPLKVPAGETFIELVPRGAGSVRIG
ncbi:DUF3048 domain-containing protein [Solicola gregarius]|uniref:DUF3048 domain-containing protein n=1 Tax=Solicola gregarius TaxID=2908642 RepID=A0AA46TEX9_9ACTN|nr:DUF3048 domain-containing protein [Solicola gregarius]UYM04102.1 DUF3048 domain-containing protein [Solicola gregarius]